MSSDTKPSQHAEHVVRYDEKGNAVAVIYFTAHSHHLDFCVLIPTGYVNPSTDLVMATIDDPDRHDIESCGFLKWDGCINFDIGSSIDGCMAHACDVAGLRQIMGNLEFIYTLGPRIESWCG